jgi:hypothetical protein
MNIENLDRRDFMRAMSVATLAAMATDMPRLALGDEPDAVIQPAPRADACILLWMAGGMSGPDTFDPKRYVPFEKGLAVERVMSTFPPIDTVVDNIKFTAGLENIARVMDRGTLIRSHVQPDLGFILHTRHQYHWHTGYVPPQTVAAPHIGAWMARVLGPRNPVMPAFIDVGQRLESHGEKEELKAFHTAGFFGGEYGPFMLPYPEDAAAAVRPPEGMSPERFEARYRQYRELVQRGPLGDHGSDFQQESMIRAMENAYRLLRSPERAAFDLAEEPVESRERYTAGIPADDQRFALGCLLARRLVEAGTRFVEVTTEYVPFEGWDTHEEGHSRAVRMKRSVDRPIAELILDLERRGLLDRTMVIVASEFSRDMMIEGIPGSTAKDQSRAVSDTLEEPRHYGLHRHFTGGSSVLVFGGGFKRGYLHGATAEERPCIATHDPVSVTDLHATIYTAMGISPKTAFDIEKRPFYATEDGKGKAVDALFA